MFLTVLDQGLQLIFDIVGALHEIRKQIIDLGVEINDSPSGVKWNWIRS